MSNGASDVSTVKRKKGKVISGPSLRNMTNNENHQPAAQVEVMSKAEDGVTNEVWTKELDHA
jgi:hypothetical protein